MIRSTTNEIPYWSLKADYVLSLLKTPERGLLENEAEERLLIFGKNILQSRQRKMFLVHFFSKFLDPLILILLFASLISAFVGGIANTIIIIVLIVISVTVDFVQEYQSQEAVEKLRNEVSIKATVIRDGIKRDLDREKIVPGDIIFLSQGDIVPADCLLLSSQNLLVKESVLTGEAFPQEKESDLVLPEETSISDRRNSLFMGTNVVTGEGKAVVVRTGSASEFGKIASELTAKRPESAFQIGIRNFGFLLTKVVFILVIFVFLVNIFLHHEILNSFLFSLALAIGLAPELLPLLITINLSKGALRMAKRKVIVKDLQAIENFGSMEILCLDKTGTFTEGAIELVAYENNHQTKNKEILEIGYLASFFETGFKNPLSSAIIDYYEKREIEPISQKYQKIAEIPFDFTRRRSSIILQQSNKTSIITRGAPEEILPFCSLSKKESDKLYTRYKNLSSQGLRLLGVATKLIGIKKDYQPNDEQNLTFLGFLIFSDPIKKTASDALAKLIEHGIILKVLTGDNELVAQKVCQEIGLNNVKTVVGNQLKALSDKQLLQVAKETTIFAKLNPEDKEKIILTLKKAGFVVGFLGDGINDAPSLRAADIGISVNNAVDVAKESADIILLDKDLHILNEGVHEGRKTYGNIMKYLMMGTSSDFGNMASVALASLFLPFLPMLPVQIFLNDLLYDVTQLTIPSDNVDEIYLDKPKKWDINFIKKFMIVFGPISTLFDLITFGLLLVIFKSDSHLFQTGWFIESITTQSLIVFSIRTKKIPFYNSKPSRYLIYVILGIVGFAWLIPLLPIKAIFSFVSPPLLFYALLFPMLLAYFLLVETAKKWFYNKYS